MRTTLIVPIVVLALAVIGALFVRHTDPTPKPATDPGHRRGGHRRTPAGGRRSGRGRTPSAQQAGRGPVAGGRLEPLNS
jgi:hypothetical protein